MNTNTNKDGFTAWVTNLGKYNVNKILLFFMLRKYPLNVKKELLSKSLCS